jgi:hypothetical protein
VWLVVPGDDACVETGDERGSGVRAGQDAASNDMTVTECNLADGGLVYCVVEGKVTFGPNRVGEWVSEWVSE